MNLTIDCYLRDQIITGELATGVGRPLDHLNTSLDAVVLLHNAISSSLYVGSDSTRLGVTLVQMDQILLAVPHDPPSTIAAQLRASTIFLRRAAISYSCVLGEASDSGTGLAGDKLQHYNAQVASPS